MKVVHVFWSLGYGGIETMLVNIANEQANQGVNVSVIVIDNVVADELRNNLLNGVNFISLGRKRGERDFKFVGKLNEVLDRINPDIVHLHESVLFNYLPHKWRTKKAHRVCCTLHALPFGTCGMFIYVARLFQNICLRKGGNVMNLNRIGRVFSISNAVSKALKEGFNIKSTVICNGINSKSFAVRPMQSPKDCFKIVQVSRLDHIIKGQDLLINAVSKLNKESDSYKLDLIGEGESRSYLESLIVSNNMQGNIKLLGAKPNKYMMEHLKDYDLFIQPSRQEGFGLTVAEAMAAKVPVLVSSGQGPEEVTEGDRYGWTFSNNDVEELAKAIHSMYKEYDQCLAKVDVAKEHVSELYDVSNSAKQYVIAYKEMLS